MYAMEKLKKDIDSILEEHAEKGIKDCKTLEIVKTALSAKSKILTIEAMERVKEEGFGRGYDRSANGQFTSYAYIAKSVPALRIYLNTTEADAVALGGKAFVNGEATQIMVDPNGNVCVDITGIRAEDLNAEFTVEFNGGVIRINALQFAKAKGGDTDLGRSMYNYYTAAHAYFV